MNNNGRAYQRRIVCAANRSESGAMILGARHWDEAMHRHYDYIKGYHESNQDDVPKFDEQGFIDQHGRFLTRTEAWKVAEAAGQIIHRCGGDTTGGGTLYSENLY